MSTDSDREPSFQDFIEKRYSEWEQEFGDEVEARRTSLEPKK
jgi:hypothetical protein